MDGKKKLGQTELAHQKTQKQEKKQGFPIYLAILLIVFGIVAGIAIQQAFFQAKPQAPQGAANAGSYSEIPIELKVFYDSSCKICANQSSIEFLFAKRKLSVAAQRLDIKIKENGILAWQNGMTTFPSSLLNWKQLKATDLEMYNSLKALFETKGDYFVVPEADLMKQTQILSQIMFLEPPTKEMCGVQKGTAKLFAFVDVLGEQSQQAIQAISELKNQFKLTLEVQEKAFPSNQQESWLAAIAIKCAAQQGKKEEFENAVLAAEFKESRNSIDAGRLKQIAAEQKITDLNAFDYCLDNQQTLEQVESDLNMARDYKLFMPPSFVIDCIYTTIGIQDLKQKICAFHEQDINACKGLQ